MSFIRNGPVDILTYLPQYLSRDKIFKATNDADNAEHERLREKIIDMQAQLYVSTATWGLSLWEKYLGITPESEDIVLRRIAILQALNRNNVSTMEFLQTIANNYIVDKSARIIEHNEQQYFEVRFNKDSCWSFTNVEGSIELYKPAHLGAIYIEEYSSTASITIGAVCRTAEQIAIDTDTGYIVPSLDAYASLGGICVLAESTIIRPDLIYEVPVLSASVLFGGKCVIEENLTIYPDTTYDVPSVQLDAVVGGAVVIDGSDVIM